MVLRADQALEIATIDEGAIGQVEEVAPVLRSPVKVVKRPEGLVLLLDLEAAAHVSVWKLPKLKKVHSSTIDHYLSG
jgi:hypothetical protein